MADMTLGQLVRSLNREIGGTINSADEPNKTYSLTVPFTDGRSQAVVVFEGTDAQDNTWFVVSSRFGAIGDLDLADLMQRNFAHYGFGSVCASGDDATVLAQLPIEHVTVDLGKQLILGVAAWADTLEEEFYGDDDA